MADALLDRLFGKKSKLNKALTGRLESKKIKRAETNLERVIRLRKLRKQKVDSE